ncbi:MAG: hypothetical protein A2218_07840 [Elusimicrobia bacterium RIFOXYA2_FULL_53_38]|nr:MAG: hypothetical protein A2218_07840 [Elusimicrobia bacterium RIFOXYA2_FULL_53_38]
MEQKKALEMKDPRNPKGAGRKWFDGKPYDVVITQLKVAWGLGCPDVEAAALADVSTASLSRFLKNHPLIAEQKERLLQKPFLSCRNAILKAIAGGDADMALRFLERKKKAEFSTRQELEVSEQEVYKELTDEQLAQIIAGKATPADFLTCEPRP